MMRDWEACYRNDETPWDKGYPAPPLQELIDRHGPELWGDGPLLVPGCGFGHDVRLLATLDLPVLGLDISRTAIEKTLQIPGTGSEWYEHGDFLDPDWHAGRHFSAIWEHTCFCAIEPARRADYARSAAAVIQPGGTLAGVFYLNPYDPGEERGGPPFEVTVDEVHDWFREWFEPVDGWVPQNAYPGRHGREWIGIFRRLEQVRIAD
jgi:hypothetical protein